jgi:hypothetical protein
MMREAALDVRGEVLLKLGHRRSGNRKRSPPPAPIFIGLVEPRSGVGHGDAFPLLRLSAGCGFRKETIAGTRRNERDAP